MIKVVTSGARGDVQMQAEILRAAVATARKHNLPVAAHAHFQEVQLAAVVRAGVTSIEHGFLLHRRARLLEGMAQDGISLCPTMRVVESIRERPDWYGQRLIPEAWPDVLRTVRAAHAAGVELVAGTDCGVYGVAWDDVWREVTLIGEACGSRWTGLRAATSAAARWLGRDDLGQLRPGSVADAVFLARSPVTSHVDRADVVAVLQAGRLVSGQPPPSGLG